MDTDTDITVDINLHIIILIFVVLFVTKLAYVPVTLVYFANHRSLFVRL